VQNGQLNWIANFIWGIADDVLEPTNDRVLAMKKQLAEQLLAWGRPLFTLPHAANGGLVGLGAKVLEVDS
jgi:hypothetical protein